MVLLIAANEQLGASQCGCFCSQEADSEGGELQVCEKRAAVSGHPVCWESLTPLPFHTCPFEPGPGHWRLAFDQMSQRETCESDALWGFPGSDIGTMVRSPVAQDLGWGIILDSFLPPTYLCLPHCTNTMKAWQMPVKPGTALHGHRPHR